MAEKYAYKRRNKLTGRMETVEKWQAVVITENLEAAQGLNDQEGYPYKWKKGKKRGRDIYRLTKMFGSGRSGKAQAQAWERERYHELRVWRAQRYTRQVIGKQYGGPLAIAAVDEYLREIKGKYHPNTYGNKERFLKTGGKSDDLETRITSFAQGFKHKPLNEIDRGLIDNYLDRLYPDSGDQVENRKYNAHKKEIRAFFKWVTRKYKWSVNPARELEDRPASLAVRNVASKAAVDLMIKKAEGQAKNILATLWWTAGRREQILALRWEDIDFKTKQMRLFTAKTKNGRIKEKYIPILPWLEPYLKDQEENYRQLSKDGHVFVNLNTAHKKMRSQKTGEPLYGCRFKYASNFVTRHCDAAGVPRFSYHALRRGLATFLYDNDVDYRDIQAVLGHDDVETTKKYIHSLRPVRKVREAIVERLNGALKE